MLILKSNCSTTVQPPESAGGPHETASGAMIDKFPNVVRHWEGKGMDMRVVQTSSLKIIVYRQSKLSPITHNLFVRDFTNC